MSIGSGQPVQGPADFLHELLQMRGRPDLPDFPDADIHGHQGARLEVVGAVGQRRNVEILAACPAQADAIFCVRRDVISLDDGRDGFPSCGGLGGGCHKIQDSGNSHFVNFSDFGVNYVLPKSPASSPPADIM